MAFSREEIEAFIAELQQDPQLRDRVRNAILADDFLALPRIVVQLGERVDQLGERVDQLGERVGQLGERVDQLAQRVDALALQIGNLTLAVDHLTGRVGNLDGRMFEVEYERHLGNRLSRRFRKVRPIPISDYDPFFAAWRSGAISETEWDDASRLDVIALAQDVSRPDEPEVVIAMELSKTVDANDVERVYRRANILGKSGVSVLALVDGESIETSAKALAAAQGVIALVQKEAQPA